MRVANPHAEGAIQPCTVFVKGRGASSTMPHKRNPISSELLCQHAGLMLDGMVQDYLA
jgi:adenylosuccinate lyase